MTDAEGEETLALLAVQSKAVALRHADTSPLLGEIAAVWGGRKAGEATPFLMAWIERRGLPSSGIGEAIEHQAEYVTLLAEIKRHESLSKMAEAAWWKYAHSDMVCDHMAEAEARRRRHDDARRALVDRLMKCQRAESLRARQAEQDRSIKAFVARQHGAGERQQMSMAAG